MFPFPGTPIGPPGTQGPWPMFLYQTTCHSSHIILKNIPTPTVTGIRIDRGLGRVVSSLEPEIDPDLCQIHYREMITAETNTGYQPKAL